MLTNIKDKLYSWANKDYFEPIFFSSSEIIDELICYLNAGVDAKNFLINDNSLYSETPNILIVSGFINHKNAKLLLDKYNRLVGPKYVITAGLMFDNQLNFPEYNRAEFEDISFITESIWGPNPTRKDVVNAIVNLCSKEAI